MIKQLHLRLAIGLILSTSLSSCVANRVAEQLLADTPTDDQEKRSATVKYGSVIFQPKSDYAVIPVGHQLNEYKRGFASSISKTPYGASQSAIAGQQNLSVINLLFHNQKNHQTHLLRPQNAFIAQFDYLLSSQTDTNKPTANHNFCSSAQAETNNLQQSLIYKIVEQDTNQNQTLDLKDAVRGYLSDLSGQNLRAISPTNTQLKQWQCDHQNKQLILWVREDLNGDRQFKHDNSDAQALYLYQIDEQQLTRISPPQSNLETWQIHWPSKTIFFQARLDSNQDKSFTSQDEIQVLTYNLNTKDTVEINSAEIRSVLTPE